MEIKETPSQKGSNEMVEANILRPVSPTVNHILEQRPISPSNLIEEKIKNIKLNISSTSKSSSKNEVETNQILYENEKNNIQWPNFSQIMLSKDVADPIEMLLYVLHGKHDVLDVSRVNYLINYLFKIEKTLFNHYQNEIKDDNVKKLMDTKQNVIDSLKRILNKQK